jgi:hypothetical protein
MAVAEVVLPYEQRLGELERIYRDAQRLLALQVKAALQSGNDFRASERRRQLEAVQATLRDLGYRTSDYARRLVREAWNDSVEHTAALIVEGGGEGLPISAHFGGVSREGVSALEASILGRLTDAEQRVGRRIEDVFARAGRRETMLGLLGSSGSRRKVSANLITTLQKQGVRGFTDKLGREWDLDRYAKMVARTTTREAVVEGAKLRMAQHGIDVARVSTHGDSCQICAPWQGRLVSLSGATDSQLGEPVATLDALPNGGPPFHPNCKHVLVPDVASIEALRRELGGVR